MASDWAQTGVAIMMIYKVLSAIGAAAMGAALVVSLPGFSPEVEARTPPPASVKSDRLDIRPLGTDCAQQAWPYYDVNCMRDVTRPRDKPARFV